MIKLILIGDEILEGFTNERNIFTISNFLRNNKKNTIDEVIVVRDKHDDIKSAISYFIEKEPKIIIITGGIGPTEDDVTIEAVSNALNLNLIKQEIETNIEKYKYTMEGFELIKNPRGKAPAHLGYYKDILIVILPGVPYEVEGFLLETKIGNIILEKLKDKLEFLVIKTNGIYETELREKLLKYYDILGSFAYLPRNDGVYLKFKGNIEKLNKIKEFLSEILKEYIWGYDSDKIEELLAKELKLKNYTISVAESFTGGKVSQILTSVSGASKYLKGSIVAYTREIKEKILNVKTKSIYSHECVIEMARNVKALFNSDIGISTSGVAGPDKDNSVEVGTCFFGISYKGDISFEYKFTGDRNNIIEKGAYFLIFKLFKLLKGEA